MPIFACMNFTSEDTNFDSAIVPPKDSFFNQGAGRIFVWGGSKFDDGTGGACFNPPVPRPIRACQTNYGWRIVIDSHGTNNYDLIVDFYQNG